ncbi:hypothetical protein L1049_026149 [Liquidambar formosana]|uniref:Uncharacterized protein n=1 Tax=Liquidambar formosana TaxID=63359 RepID=A0AAP0R784_LIQFO
MPPFAQRWINNFTLLKEVSRSLCNLTQNKPDEILVHTTIGRTCKAPISHKVVLKILKENQLYVKNILCIRSSFMGHRIAGGVVKIKRYMQAVVDRETTCKVWEL